MIRLTLAIFAWFLAMPALAETVHVRSGEHAGFSRLVMEFSRPTAWTLDKMADGYLLSLGRQDISFDFSRVFHLIPRTRLSNISVDLASGAVLLKSDCECEAEAFEIKPGRLVIDLKDKPELPVAESPEQSVADEISPTAPISLPAYLGRSAVPFLTAVPGGGLPEAPAPGSATDPAAGPDMQALLLKALARAAAQGLVHVSTAPDAETVGAAIPGPSSGDDAHDTAIRIETSIDRDNRLAQQMPETATVKPCLADRLFAFFQTSGASPAPKLIADARGALIGEFDRVQPEALGRFVRTYLYLGFGAEARNAMQAFDARLPNADLLADLANIMDGRSAGSSTLRGQQGCDGSAALWSVLAQPGLPPGPEINQAAVTAAFSALPAHLRRHLGPGLADRFIDAGEIEVATQIRNAIDRAGADDDPGLALLESQLELGKGDVSAAEAALDNVIASNDSHSSEALLQVMQARIDMGQPPRAEDIANAEALVFEHRGSGLGADLARVAILGHALNGDYSAAFSLLLRHPVASQVQLNSEFALALSEHAPDADFLRFATALVNTPGFSLLEDSAKAVFERFVDLGFPELAGAISGQVQAGAQGPDHRRGLQIARGGSVAKPPPDHVERPGPLDVEVKRDDAPGEIRPSLAGAYALLEQSAAIRAAADGALAITDSEVSSPE